MKTLFWNVRESSTRAALLEATCSQLDDEARGAVEERCCAAGVPDGHCHNLAEVHAVVDALCASDRVKQDLRSVYRILAEAEAAAHGCTVDQTHFHEVGNAAGIRNALHICLAIEAVAPDEIVCTSVQTGEGMVACAHGELAVPAPATAAILARGIPVCDSKLPGERCTPTSAALIWHFADRFEA